jgi:hypothetical protein
MKAKTIYVFESKKVVSDIQGSPQIETKGRTLFKREAT